MSARAARRIRFSTITTTVTAVAAALVTPSLPQAGAAGPEPIGVTTLRAGVASLAEVFLPGYAETAPLAEPVPLADTSPGVAPLRPAAALKLADVLDQGVHDVLLASNGTAGSLAELMTQVDALDGTVGGVTLDVATANAVSDGGTIGFDLSMTVSKTQDAGLAITDPSGPGGDPVTVRSGAAGAPYNMAFRFSASLRAETSGDRFWLVKGPSTPSVGVDVGLAGAGAFTFPEAKAAIGVGDVTVRPGSTADLDAHWSGGILDSDSDGRITEFEPAVDGSTATPGELTMPAGSLTQFARSGTADASIGLGSSLIPLETSPAPTLTLDADLSSLTELAADLVSSQQDALDMEAFTRISAVDLVTAVTQYGALVRSLQTHPSVDAVMPLVSGRLSELQDLSKPFTALANALVTITPPPPGQAPTTEAVVVHVKTIGELADRLDNVAGFVGGTLVPTYDPATQRVTLDLKYAGTLDGFEPVDGGPAGEVGRIAFGDQLNGITGLRGVSRPVADTPVPQQDTAYSWQLPLLVDLSPAVAANDDLATQPVEFESPMVYERFETRLVEGNELSVTSLLKTTADGIGSIGIVPATVGGTYQLKQDGTNPTTYADVDPAAGETATPRMNDLLPKIFDDAGDGTYPVANATRRAVVDADLTMAGHGAGSSNLTTNAGTFTVDGAGFDPAAYTTVLTNDEARMLAALDVDKSTPSRLMGRLLDSVGAVADQLSAVGGTELPLIDRTPGDLLGESVDLDGAVDQLRAVTPPDLSALETTVEQLLQAGGNGLSFQLRDLDPAQGTIDPALVVRFDVDHSTQVDVPISLALGSLSVTGGENGNLPVDVAGSLDLGVLVPLTPESSPLPGVRVLDGSRAQVTATVTESEPGAMQFKVNLGVGAVQLGDSTNKTGRLAFGAKVALAAAGAPPPGSALEQPKELAQFISDLAPTLSSAAEGGSYTCDPDGATSSDKARSGELGCLSMPVLVEAGGLHTMSGDPVENPNETDYLRFGVGTSGLVNPTAPTVNWTALGGFSFDSLGDGFKSIAKLLDAAIAASAAGGELPLVGGDLTAASASLKQVKEQLTTFQANVPDGDVATVVYGPNGLRSQLWNLFDTQLHVLPDGSYAKVYDPTTEDTASDQYDDIRIVAACGAVKCAWSAPATDITEVRVEMVIGQGPTAQPIPIDLGLDGLPISFTGKAELSAGWSMQLGFGLSLENGFFLLDNPLPATNTPDDGDAEGEFTVGVNGKLFADAATKIRGEIGFINMEASQHPGAPDSAVTLQADLGLDGSGPCTPVAAPFNDGVGDPSKYCTGQVPVTLLITDPGNAFSDPDLQVGAHLHADIVTGVGGVQEDSALPTFTTEFKFDWEVTEAGPGDPTIKFLNLGVRPGELVKNSLGEVLNEINTFMEPTEELRDFLFDPIPVVNDISEFVGGPKISMIWMADKMGYVDAALLEDINTLINFASKLAEASESGDSIILVNELDINDAVATGAPREADQVTSLFAQGTQFNDSQLESFMGNAFTTASSGDYSKLQADSGDKSDGQADLSFPMFQKPECLPTLLFGGDCVIAEWRPDDLHIEAKYTQSIGPFWGVLYITFGGSIIADANFGAGISTRGIRLALTEGVGSGEDIGTAILRSLYLTDTDRAGKDVTEFSLTGELKVGAKFDAFIVAAGVNGGIGATFGMNLNDTPQADGKMYFDEIVDKLDDPLCLFDLEGKLYAFVEVWASFGVCPFCYEKSWRPAEVTLFEWSHSCNGTKPKPNLARNVGNVVQLNVGPLAPSRGVKPDEINEVYVVRQVTQALIASGEHAGQHEFEIQAFGASETYWGTSLLVADAGNGADSFSLVGGSGQPKPGEDSSNIETKGTLFPFSVPATGNLGTGNDGWRGGDGPDTVHGNDGQDMISLGAGTNTAFGDDGNDQVAGGTGKDDIDGGAHNDVIDGGLEGDTLKGGPGDDVVTGGSDILVVPIGQTAPDNATAQNKVDLGDTILGGSGNDTLKGGSGDDIIHGDDQVTQQIHEDEAGPPATGDDLIEGQGGADTAYGGRGADTIFGGFRVTLEGNDTSIDKLQGNGGNDKVYGSGGDDEVYGGPDADLLSGDAGADTVDGQSGDDTEVRGGDDKDKVWGGAGDDHLFGDGGDDEMFGDGSAKSTPPGTPGSDTADGGPGADIVLGDNGTIDGPAGARVAHPSDSVGADDPSLGGGDGDDRIYGEAGGDTLVGGSGRDLLHGNAGEDVGHGQTGDDEVWGDGDHDQLFGGTEDDVVFGNGADDEVHGSEGADLLVGGHPDPAGGDTGDDLYGGPENDRIYGDDVTVVAGGNGRYDASDAVTFAPSGDASTYGDDTADGGSGLDEIHGQDGDDDLWGAEDLDQIFGELGGDDLHGEGGPDYLVGDQGTITPGPREIVAPDGGWKPGTPLGSPMLEVHLVAPGAGGIDTIWGDFDDADDTWAAGGDDHAWGGADDDLMRGGSYDDTFEGNAGEDELYGFDLDSDHELDGADDLTGGSSPVNPLASTPAGAPDEGETQMQGNGLDDVMLGDNAVVTRVADPANPAKWKVDPVTGGVFRELVLLDTEKTGAALDLVSGGDFMVGNDENDRMFGEGGTDLVKGNAGDDLVEGNQDGDWLEGNDDEDDLIGGSSFPDQPDTGDVLWGGGGADVLAGDNTCLVRKAQGVPFEPASCEQLDSPAPTEFDYVTSQLGVETPRGVVLHDTDAAVAGEYGADQLNGGSGVDVEFGQDGTDFVFGDGGGDFQFGNGDADVVVGDRPVSSYASIAIPTEVNGTLPPLAPIPSGLPGTASTGEQLVGADEADGQDDQTGGSNRAAIRDAGDWIFGDGEADFQLGDNGELNRTIQGDHYDVYEERYPSNTPPADGSAVIERDVTRYDVGGNSSYSGADLVFGGNGTNPLISLGAGDGDDSQWGQDGNDQLFGEDDNDDQYGELGDDTLWGGAGEDAMVGDRGGIQTRFVEADGSDTGDPLVLTYNSQGPPGINLGGPQSGPQDATLHPFEAHPLDRRTSLTHDRDGSVLTANGLTAGGSDRLRGGPGHDSIHGGFGNDYANGDSDGDYLFGDDGADVMWGGLGRYGVLDQPARDAMGEKGEWIDVLFGGHGANNTAGGADILDYQPRAGVEPALWFQMVAAYADSAAENDGHEFRQHHHGTDWLYGGWDRDVLQGDVAANGPNDGDKLIDWNGAYNLYTHCNAAYGGWNDVRKIDPNNIEGLNRLAYVAGATADFDGRPVLTDVTTPGTSAYREAAIVYSQDVKQNSGSAFPTTPGHFEQFICSED